MSASSPEPRYYKDGRGLHPTWRLRLRHPIYALRFTPLNRLRIRWHDRGYKPGDCFHGPDEELQP